MTAEEQKRMDDLEAENAKLRGENSELQDKLLDAQKTLAKYAQMLFGQKTERTRLPEKPEELTGNLFEQELDPEEQARLDTEAAKALAEEEKSIHVAAHDRKVRKPIDTSKLEVREEHIRPELVNEDDYIEMEPEVTDSLVLVPKKMYIHRIIRHKYVLKSKLQVENPDRQTFLIAPLPPAALHKCMADASLLADIIISKYLYHLPFYRVIETYKELGVTISSSTINDWFKAVVGKVKPLYDLTYVTSNGTENICIYRYRDTQSDYTCLVSIFEDGMEAYLRAWIKDIRTILIFSVVVLLALLALTVYINYRPLKLLVSKYGDKAASAELSELERLDSAFLAADEKLDDQKQQLRNFLLGDLLRGRPVEERILAESGLETDASGYIVLALQGPSINSACAEQITPSVPWS